MKQPTCAFQTFNVQVTQCFKVVSKYDFEKWQKQWKSREHSFSNWFHTWEPEVLWEATIEEGLWNLNIKRVYRCQQGGKCDEISHKTGESRRMEFSLNGKKKLKSVTEANYRHRLRGNGKKWKRKGNAVAWFEKGFMDIWCWDNVWFYLYSAFGNPKLSGSCGLPPG